MPLVKLWNSLRGRSKESLIANDSVPETGSVQSAATEGLSSQGPTSTGSLAGESTRGSKSGSRGGSKRRLFGGGPHSQLCKQIKNLEVASVLEVGVGDGSRALAVLSTLSKRSVDPVRYHAIDEFELGGGQIGLRDFYCLLRESDLRPHIFPETLDAGLRSVANTVGMIDLILFATPDQGWQNPITLQLLSRISHPNTVVFFEDGDTWVRYAASDAGIQRRAA